MSDARIIKRFRIENTVPNQYDYKTKEKNIVGHNNNERGEPTKSHQNNSNVFNTLLILNSKYMQVIIVLSLLNVVFCVEV